MANDGLTSETGNGNDSDALIQPIPTPIPTPLNVTVLARRFGVARSTIQRRLRRGWVPPTNRPAAASRTKTGVAPRRSNATAPAVLDAAAGATPDAAPLSHLGVASMSHLDVAPRARGVRALALLIAVALASVSGFFGVVGMTAIYAAAALPIMIMVGVLEAAKLITAAWLARSWRVAPFLLRAPMVVAVLLLMALTATGTFGFLSAAHIQHQAVTREAVDRDAAPVTQQIALAKSAVADLDGQIRRLDAMVSAATVRARTRTAMELVDTQAKARAQLVAERQAAAEKLADLKVEQANIEAQRARVAADEGPALYLAKLFHSDDAESMVRRITALIVLVLDPLAIMLTIAAAV